MPTNPVLVVHGGAWAIPDDMVEAHLNGVRNAATAGWSALERGGSALDAVEEAVVVMEDDDTFDAGRGSFLNRDGKVQLDALIMDGATLKTGGVGCVEHIANPVRAWFSAVLNGASGKVGCSATFASSENARSACSARQVASTSLSS